MSKARNLTVATMILLLSAFLVATVVVMTPVKAQSTSTVWVYNSQGGDIDANGTQLTPSTTYNYTTGDVISYTPVPGSGFSFYAWDWISGSTAVTSTSTTLTETLSSSACAIQAMFIPTTNATQTVSGSGSATIVGLMSAGGTTSPASGTSTSSPTSSDTGYTIGQTATLTATASSGWKFLYWLVVSAQGRTDYTSSTVSVTVPASEMAIQAFFVPTSSSLAAPGVSPSPSVTPTPTPEYSSVIIVAIVAALVAVAAATVCAKRIRR